MRNHKDFSRNTTHRTRPHPIMVLLAVLAISSAALAPPDVRAQTAENNLRTNRADQGTATLDGKVLDSWRKQTSEARIHPVNIVVIGDSIACCIGPTDYENTWTNVLRQRLALQYGDHGSGIIPVGNNEGLSTNPQWSIHPYSGSVETIAFGPFQSGEGAFGSVFRLRGEAQLTVLLPAKRPDRIVLYYASASDSTNGITVHYQDGVLATVGRIGSPAFKARSVSIPIKDSGYSRLSFSAASVDGSAYIYGIEFIYGNSGISLHNLAHGYARTEAWGSHPEQQLAFLSQIQGGIQLAIVSLGVNDSINGAGTTDVQYRDNMSAIVAQLRRLNPRMAIVIFDEISTEQGESASLLSQNAVRRQEMVMAQKLSLGFVSPLAVFGTSPSAVKRGLFSRDKVHPNDLGDRLIADVIQRYLQSSVSDRITSVSREVENVTPSGETAK